MELKFSEMSVDTSLAKEYLDKNKTLLELCNDYEGIIKKIKQQDKKYVYNGKTFITKPSHIVEERPGADYENITNILRIMASSLKKNANLIAQLEYLFRNIPIEVTNAQLNLLIQYMNCCHGVADDFGCNYFFPDDSLLVLGTRVSTICGTNTIYCISRETAAICHLLITLLHDAHDEKYKDCYLQFHLHSIFTREDIHSSRMEVVKGLDSGTVAVVCDDADVDSAVDKLISVSKQAPWRLRRILVQESVYQQFKDSLSWKCNLKTSGDKQTSDVLCSDSLTYNDITFLMDPVELVEENPSVVTVEAYRTTKEMISLVQQDKTRYLSLWANGIAGINEVTHATESPVVWVNTVADFRGPAQVSEAVFSYNDISKFSNLVVDCDSVTKLSKLSQSWLKLDVESRRDILCSVLDKYMLLNNTNKQLTEIKNSLFTCTRKSFVDVGKDYVCIGMSPPFGGVTLLLEKTIFSVESFKAILQGNALLLTSAALEDDFSLLEQAGVPAIRAKKYSIGKRGPKLFEWKWGLDSITRVIWTNSGTIFAN